MEIECFYVDGVVVFVFEWDVEVEKVVFYVCELLEEYFCEFFDEGLFWDGWVYWVFFFYGWVGCCSYVSVDLGECDDEDVDDGVIDEVGFECFVVLGVIVDV